MYKLTDIIGKTIICFANGKKIGTVTGVDFDENFSKAEQIIFCDEAQKNFSLPFDKMQLGEDALVLKNENNISCFKYNICSPLGFEVFDHLGKCWGEVCDAELSANGATKKLLCKDYEYSLKTVFSCIDKVFIVCQNPPMLKALRRASTLNKPEEQSKIKFSFLLGRKILRDIIVKDEKIAKKNDIISLKVLERCKFHEKLITLARYSK